MPADPAQPESTGTQEETSSSRAFPWLWVGAFLLFYPLSAGPAIRLWDAHILTKQALWVYAPLGVICQHCGPAEKLMSWYVEDVWQFKPIIK